MGRSLPPQPVSLLYQGRRSHLLFMVRNVPEDVAGRGRYGYLPGLMCTPPSKLPGHSSTGARQTQRPRRLDIPKAQDAGTIVASSSPPLLGSQSYDRCHTEEARPQPLGAMEAEALAPPCAGTPSFLFPVFRVQARLGVYNGLCKAPPLKFRKEPESCMPVISHPTQSP